MSGDRGHEQHEIDINDLPDCILLHILSFMPTKEVVKTSALCKRWKNLWASAPNIVIGDALWHGIHRPHATYFVNIVERVLRSRDAALNIKKFHLSCSGFSDASQIHSWISDVIKHNVQELCLFLPADDPSMIPRSLFDSTSLVSVKIRTRILIELPAHVSFPCLKTLHLSSIQFPNDDSTEKLFSGCPVLEKLVIVNCCLKNLKNIAISSSTLKSLTICGCSGICESSNSSSCNIRFPVFRNLTHLMLDMKTWMDHTFSMLMHLLSLCPVVQSICFDEGYRSNGFFGENNSTWSSIPICISNCLKIVTFKSFNPYTPEICFLKCVLKHANVLESIDIRCSDIFKWDLKGKAKVMEDLEKIEKMSAACVIKFSYEISRMF